MTSRFRVLLAATVVLALVAGGGVAVAVAVAEDPDHEHPDEVDDGDDLDAVQRWLGDRMGRMHVDCTEGIRVGNFDACEDLDDEYGKHLSRYVAVERETTSGDDRQAERYNETREKQAELARLLQEFERTREDYREAREADDEERAREHGRELISLAQRIEALGGDVAVNFRHLDGQTSDDLNASADAINGTTEEVVTIRRDVEEESFVATELSMAVDDTASFESPATVSGTLEDEDGVPIAGATIAIEDDETNATVLTDEDGEFTGEYRPTVTEPGETNVTVRYIPSNASTYLGSQSNATVDVEQTATTTTVSDATSEAGFDDTVTVAGEVEAADRGAPGVPVTVLVDGRAIATERTDEDGSFEVSTEMPADVPTGDADVVVRASGENRSLEPSEAEYSMAVTETGTELNVSTTATEGEVRISGVVLADVDEAVGKRPVEVAVGDEIRTVTTEPDGSYALTVEQAPEDRDVTATYDEAGTNLGSSTASTTIPGHADAGGGLGGGLGVDLASIDDLVDEYPGLAVGAVGALLALAAAARALWRRREGAGGTGTPGGPDPPGSTGAAAAAGGVESSRSQLERARELLSTAPNEAVKASYAAVRFGLGGEDRVRTHWEFYNDRTAQLPADHEAALRALTEFFERAAFAPRGIDPSDAEAALVEAERCLASTDGGTFDPTTPNECATDGGTADDSPTGTGETDVGSDAGGISDTDATD